MKLLYGDSAARKVSERIAAKVATIAELRQTPSSRRVDGQIVHVDADNTLWQWNASAVCSGDNVLAVLPDDGPATGRWMRMPGRAMLRIPIYATTPTGTNILTVPSGSILALEEFAWSVSRVFTGSSNACLAVSSSNHKGHTGVANFAGSAIATQLNNWFSATANGTGVDFLMATASGTFNVANHDRGPWMKGGDTIRLDVIGAQFGTGVGAVLVACDILQNPGA
jgi:hypothetical protein